MPMPPARRSTGALDTFRVFLPGVECGRVLEYWMLSAIVAGSFIAGLVSAVKYLTKQ